METVAQCREKLRISSRTLERSVTAEDDACSTRSNGTFMSTGDDFPPDTLDEGGPIHDFDHPIGRFRNLCGAIVNSTPARLLIIFLIVANAILLGIETFDFVKNNEQLRSVFNKVDISILSLYSTELFLHFAYLGCSFFRNGWLVFDLIITILSWAFLGSAVAILRSFRIFSVFRLVARWKSLRRLFAAVGKTLPNMATIWIALLIFFYIFTVLFTTLYNGLWEQGYLDYDYFGRLDYTFLTLFQFMTLDSWTAVVRQVMEDRPAAWIGFVAWVIVTAFFVLNLMVAVICESLVDFHYQSNKEQQRKILQKQRKLVLNQTESFLQEFQAMMEMQRQMLETQKAMQQTLFEIAQNFKPPDRSTEESSIQSEKSSLTHLVNEVNETEQSENETILSAMKLLNEDSDASTK